MATRSTITHVTSDNKIQSIYCHWDGNITGVGMGLMKHINPNQKVKALIAEGNRSTLGADAYHHTEGWGGNRPASFIEPQEYNYVYDEVDEQWYVFSYHIEGAETYSNRIELTRELVYAKISVS